MPLILSGNVATATAATTYEVANSCRFNSGDSPSLKDGDGSAPAGNRQKFTFSVWFKRAKLGVTQMFAASAYSSGDEGYLYINGSDHLVWHHSSSGMGLLVTTQKFRDVGAWYNLVWSVDTTQSTAANRMKFYINGSQVTSFSTETYPDEDKELYWNVGGTYYPWIGRRHGGDYWDGYLAEIVHIDNAQLAATSFGEFDEDSPTIWKPKDVSGLTFGTAGYHLDFEDSGELGKDVSGQGNHFGTVANLAATDQATDTCTLNYMTLNPLAAGVGDTARIPTFSEGNTKFTAGGSNTYYQAISTFGVSVGKWYFEVKIASDQDLDKLRVGYWNIDKNVSSGEIQDVSDANSHVFYMNKDGGEMRLNTSVTTANYGTFADNDIMGVAIDMDNRTISIYKNGSVIVDAYDYSGGIAAGTVLTPAFMGYDDTAFQVNYGNPHEANSSDAADGNGYGAFEYAPPTNYLAYNSANLGSDGG